MNWVAFAVLVFLTTVLQTSVAPFVAVHTIRPDGMVILAVFFALYARNFDAMLACWIIGLVVDLASLSYWNHANVGLHALSLGLLGFVIVRTRGLTFREGVLSHLVYTFLTAWAMTFILGVHLLWGRPDWTGLGQRFAVAFYTAIYTAGVAPYGHWCLRQIRVLLGLGSGQGEMRR